MNKKTKKAIYSLCAAAGFLSSLFVPCYSSGGQMFSAAELAQTQLQGTAKLPTASDFTDIDNTAWYYPYVDHLVKNSIIKGVTQDTYVPDGTFTLAECAAVITRYLGLEAYAEQQKASLTASGTAGAELWFSGYIQTLLDAGILIPEEFGISPENGIFGVPDIFNRPIRRYEFANLITRSFDISTETVKAKNLFAEVCDNGNSFIIGAKYDDTVSLYSGEISDFEAIPEAYRENVLKAYYNGIFNGDAVGNFNPESNLSRSEMSKVVAVITNRELRSRTEYRKLPEVNIISEDKYITDGWGQKTLDRNYAYQILTEASWNMNCSFDGAETSISYVHGAFPENYGIEVRAYNNIGGVYTLGAQMLSNGTSLQYKGSDMRVLFTLRNLENAKIEGVLRVDISPDGTISYTNMYKDFSK